jgi:hypothetical protein
MTSTSAEVNKQVSRIICDFEPLFATSEVRKEDIHERGSEQAGVTYHLRLRARLCDVGDAEGRRDGALPAISKRFNRGKVSANSVPAVETMTM